MIQQVGSVQFIVRCAWADQYPKGADIRNMARDSVIRYASHFGLEFVWVHDQYGERWKDGCPQGVYGWRSEARVTGKVATSEASL